MGTSRARRGSCSPPGSSWLCCRSANLGSKDSDRSAPSQTTRAGSNRISLALDSSSRLRISVSSLSSNNSIQGNSSNSLLSSSSNFKLSSTHNNSSSLSSKQGSPLDLSSSNSNSSAHPLNNSSSGLSRLFLSGNNFSLSNLSLNNPCRGRNSF